MTDKDKQEALNMIQSIDSEIQSDISESLGLTDFLPIPPSNIGNNSSFGPIGQKGDIGTPGDIGILGEIGSDDRPYKINYGNYPYYISSHIYKDGILYLTLINPTNYYYATVNSYDLMNDIHNIEMIKKYVYDNAYSVDEAKNTKLHLANDLTAKDASTYYNVWVKEKMYSIVNSFVGPGDENIWYVLKRITEPFESTVDVNIMHLLLTRDPFNSHRSAIIKYHETANIPIPKIISSTITYDKVIDKDTGLYLTYDIFFDKPATRTSWFNTK